MTTAKPSSPARCKLIFSWCCNVKLALSFSSYLLARPDEMRCLSKVRSNLISHFCHSNGALNPIYYFSKKGVWREVWYPEEILRWPLHPASGWMRRTLLPSLTDLNCQSIYLIPVFAASINWLKDTFLGRFTNQCSGPTRPAIHVSTKVHVDIFYGKGQI